MPDLTPEQQVAQQKAKELAEARAKVKADNKTRRDKYRAMVGQVFTNGDDDAFITGFDKSHITTQIDAQGLSVHAESFIYHLGNPNHQQFMACEKFLCEFQLKT